MNLYLFTIPSVILETFDGPGDCVAESFSKHRHTGLAYGRQTLSCPLTRTALPQLMHKDAVRQEDHIQVPGLALATSKLTIAHAQLLLAVPMEALGACPTVSIDPQNPCHFPAGTIRDQNLAGVLVLTLVP